MKGLLAGALLAGVCLAASACMGPPAYRDARVQIVTAQAVDLGRYQGLWYEIARYPNSFERGCAGVTAEYAPRPGGSVSVRNTCRRGDDIEVAEGRAHVVPDSNNSRLKVRFAPAWVPFAEGDYWVLFVDEAYRVALVGAPSGRYLWILAREPIIDPQTRDQLEAVARENGFNPAMLENTMQQPQ